MEAILCGFVKGLNAAYAILKSSHLLIILKAIKKGETYAEQYRCLRPGE